MTGVYNKMFKSCLECIEWCLAIETQSTVYSSGVTDVFVQHIIPKIVISIVADETTYWW